MMAYGGQWSLLIVEGLMLILLADEALHCAVNLVGVCGYIRFDISGVVLPIAGDIAVSFHILEGT